MSYNPRTLGAPTSYTRQTSFEEDGPSSSSSSSAARYGGLPSSSSSNVNRRPTVRGAVRGTIREAGVNPRLSMGVVVPGRTLTRGKTLTRPDRFVAPAPLINPGLAPGGHNKSGGAVQTKLVDGKPTLITSEPWWEPWGLFVEVSTWWAPRWLLRRMGMTDPIKQRAWKEKCALCTVSAMLMAIVGFITIGLNRTLCPSDATSRFTRLGSDSGFVGIHGWAFDVAATTPSALLNPSNTKGGMDVTGLFDLSSLPFPGCDGITAAYATTNLCTGTDLTTANATCSYTAPASSLYSTLSITNTTKQVGYDWDQLSNLTHYLVLDGNVLNLTPYMLAHPTPIANDTVDTAIRFMLEEYNGSGGRDATRIFNNEQALRSSIKCLEQRYYAGHLDKITPGCFVSNLFLYVSLGLIMTIVLARFVMACIYSWYLSHKLVAPPKNLKRQVISPAVMPEGANIDVDNTTGAAPWTNQEVQRRATQRLKKGETRRAGGGGGARGAGQVVAEKEKEYLEKPMGGGGGGGRQGPEALDTEGMINMASIGAELFCVCLVTCYSEGAEGIRSTLDSIAGTTYSDARKLIFIVCDGMITGDGETASTPDICVGMLEADPRFGEPQAMSYLSIGHGAKAHNQAMVYAGHYTNAAGHRTPTIIVVKCGPPEEAKEKKPGNRGKRDSQMILMNFFSRVTYNDRMSPLDYDLFRKTQSLMGVTPDFFEVCLMVDADTKVYPDSLGYLVRTMQNDNMIMGVCGETRIANKRQSWVTMIQVFEYFISHHQSKAFESVFGGVTCLPGCFSMYRLKARKEDDGDWFPVLVQPQIVSEYSQSVVTTLHQKNLLLLGEDRFLTTLLLRTFPNRKMMFCPQARCRTIAPDTFAVLLSQRRRWINSTVHNLMELVLVRNLCGTFCFSMQFVVMVDLIGTVVLPIAICLTGILIISAIITPPNSFSDAIPLMLLGAVLGLPGVLILISTFKIVYIGWMFIYLLALPIWNFVLPLYSFSKFDDFSWGETRKVAGEVKGDDGHGAMGGEVANVPLRRWEDWERSRLRKMKRDERRRRDFERQFGSRQTYQSSNSLWDDSTAHSETASSYGGDEDRWGMEIGQYSEDGPTLAPPPIGLFHIDADSSEGDHETIAEHELELVLDQGWQEDDSPHGRPYGSGYASPRPMSPQVPPTLYALSDAPVMQKTWSSNSHEPLNQSASSSVEQFAAQDPFNNTNYVSNYGCTSPIASPIPSPYQQQHAQMLPAGASSGVEGSGAYGHVKNRSLSSTNSSPVIARGGREASGGAETPSPTREQYGQGRRIA